MSRSSTSSTASAGAVAAGPARTNWAAVIAALAVGVTAAFTVGKLPPALPGLKDELGLSLVAAGWVVSMFNTLAAAGGIFFGLVTDRIGALRACYAGLGLLVAGGLLGAIADGAALLLLSRFVEGAGLITAIVAAPALMFTATAPQDRKLVLGINSSYMPFGMTIAILAAPGLLGAVGWRGLWVAVAAAVCAAAVAVHFNARAFPATPVAARTFRSISEATRQPAPWWLALAMACYTAQWSAVAMWLPTFLVQDRALSVASAAGATALYTAINIPGNQTGTWLIGRHASRGALIAITSLAGAALGVAIFSGALPDHWRFAACLAQSYVIGMIPAAVMTSPQAYARTPAQVGTLQGLLMQGSNVGQFVGPPAIAAVVAATGRWDAAVYVLVAAALLGAACGLVVRGFERRLSYVKR